MSVMQANPQTVPQPVVSGSGAGKKAISHLLAALVLAVTFTPFGTSLENTAVQPEVNAAYLPNFHTVDSYLYRGGSPSYEGLVRLKELGVKTIIDLRQDAKHIIWERAYAEQLGLTYVNIPMGNFVPSLYKQQTFFKIVGDAANKPSEYGPVFMHCSHGSDRTGFLTALWRMKHDHWSVASAFAEMLRYGFLVHKIK